MKGKEWQHMAIFWTLIKTTYKKIIFFALYWLEASHVLNNFSINKGKNIFDDTVIRFGQHCVVFQKLIIF